MKAKDSITLCGGKYIIYMDTDRLLNAKRHGEVWPAFRNGGGHFKGYVLAMFHELLEQKKNG